MATENVIYKIITNYYIRGYLSCYQVGVSQKKLLFHCNHELADQRSF